jgi:predicted nuclease of predicted toxin-antitoxin system
VRFLIDANLPRAVIAVFQKHGHDTVFARDVGLSEATDEQIASQARARGCALVTRDLDFADVRRYPPQQYAGIVVLRVPDDTVADRIARMLDLFLGDQLLVDALAGRLAIVEPERVRFRPPLTSQ